MMGNGRWEMGDDAGDGQMSDGRRMMFDVVWWMKDDGRWVMGDGDCDNGNGDGNGDVHGARSI